MFPLAFCIFVIFLTVYADGPYCSQSGLGPPDMMIGKDGKMEMNPKYMWEKVGGSVHVPVLLDHAYTHEDREVIFGGLAEMASKTCINFLVYKHPGELTDRDHVFITKTKSSGCWSYVGKQGGGQDLSLPVGCINHRTVMHEMMHALGFSHEHVRADRDKYVKIVWNNIQRGRERNFEKKRDSKSDAFGPYDYLSIMHYARGAFSSNGADTIKPLRPFAQIGNTNRMSSTDALKINRAYKCYNAGKNGYHYGPTSGVYNQPTTDDDTSFGHEVPLKSFPRLNPFLGGNEIDHEGEGPEDADVEYSYRPSHYFNMEHDDFFD